ncbi:MAG: hypothetical protein ACK59M_11575 [Pseudomonadota bacterium]|jgi:hypothetical protein
MSCAFRHALLLFALMSPAPALRGQAPPPALPASGSQAPPAPSAAADDGGARSDRRQQIARRLADADRDGDGRWTREEIGGVAPRLAEGFAQADADGDGSLDRDEIRRFVRERRSAARGRGR